MKVLPEFRHHLFAVEVSLNEDVSRPIPELAASDVQPSLWRHLFQVDLRSLALLRMVLGGLLILDLILYRFPYSHIFYSQAGVLLGDNVNPVAGSGAWTLYLISGSVWWARLLMIAELFAALAFLVGFKTRWAALVCLILVWSLHVRNPMVLTVGDIMLRLMLAWSVLLPMGAMWSVDARHDPWRNKGNVNALSLATMGIMLQVVMMYFFAGLSKCNYYWIDGNALAYILQLDMFVKPMGSWLAEFPWLTKLLTWGTLSLELIGPFLLFIPYKNEYFRGLLMALFWLMHLWIWATMSVGLLSLIMMASWIVFIPSSVWGRMGIDVVTDPTIDPGPYSISEERFNFLALLLVLYGLFQNIANAVPGDSAENLRATLRTVGRVAMVVQDFRLFHQPPLYSPRFDYRARLIDGSRVDLFTEQPLDANAESLSVYESMRSHPWRRYHSNLVLELVTDPDHSPSAETLEFYQGLRERLLFVIARDWNRSNGTAGQVQEATLECYLNRISAHPMDSTEIYQQWAVYPVN